MGVPWFPGPFPAVALLAAAGVVGCSGSDHRKRPNGDYSLLVRFDGGHSAAAAEALTSASATITSTIERLGVHGVAVPEGDIGAATAELEQRPGIDNVIIHAADQGAHVILVGSGAPQTSSALEDAVRCAVGEQVIVVAATDSEDDMAEDSSRGAWVDPAARVST